MHAALKVDVAALKSRPSDASSDPWIRFRMLAASAAASAEKRDAREGMAPPPKSRLGEPQASSDSGP